MKVSKNKVVGYLNNIFERRRRDVDDFIEYLQLNMNPSNQEILDRLNKELEEEKQSN
jgi:hypothetical protein